MQTSTLKVKGNAAEVAILWSDLAAHCLNSQVIMFSSNEFCIELCYDEKEEANMVSIIDAAANLDICGSVNNIM